MPANQIKQYHRGRIQEGAYADVIVFDFDKIQDKATYTDSKKYAEGIEQMLINGVFVIKNAKLTNNTPGVWLHNKSVQR